MSVIETNPGRDQRIGGALAQDAQARRRRGQDEGELADLRRGDGHGYGGAERVVEPTHHGDRDQRFGQQDHAEGRGEEVGRLEEIAGAEEDADGDEEEDGEGVAHRQRLGGGPEAELRAAHDQPCQEGTQRHREPEEPGRPHRDTQGQHEHREREQLARPRGRDPGQQPGDEALADDQHQPDHHGQLDEARPTASTRPPMPLGSGPNMAGSRTSTKTVSRSSTISQPTATRPVTD